MAVIIHQALHGYSDGHRLISSSVPLSSNEARMMVVMSDLSGPGVKPEVSGYLTGYPLEGSGKYVLARTWPALEMPRPGCVWTHSLILDNADLAKMASADDLLRAFVRPTSPPAEFEYTSPATIYGAPARSNLVSRDRARSLLNALYAAPQQMIIAEVGKGEDDERLLAAIWMQQWPRLRRSFGFCTLAGMDRSGKGVLLDLSLVRSTNRQDRARFPHAVTPSEVTSEGALEPLTADLEEDGGSQLREFLRRAGGDVEGGRQAMLPLCQLHSSLFSSKKPNLPAAVAALDALDSHGRRQARSVRTLIVREALADVDDIDDAVFEFVIATLEQSERANDQPVDAARLGAALWRRSPVRLVRAISTGGVVGKASAEALLTIAAPELVKGLRNNPQLADRVLSVRPDLLERVDFWKIPNLEGSLAEGVDAVNAGRVAVALLGAGRVGPAQVVIAQADPEELAAAFDGASSQPVLNEWFRGLTRDLGKTAAVLASGRIKRRSVVIGLARATEPDMVPNDYGEDPWFLAVSGAGTQFDQSSEDYLAAFLMARALGSRSRSQAGLIQFSYTTLYRAFQHSRLPSDIERMVSLRLHSGGWFGWDNCSRLRATVANRFVDRNLDAQVFGSLTDDGQLAMSLIDEAAKTDAGRRFLSRVRKHLKDSNEKGVKEKIDYIAKRIK